MDIKQIKKELASHKGKSFGTMIEFPAHYGKARILPNTGHPRVWVNEKTLPKVKENLHRGENAAVFERIKATADEALEGNGIIDASTGKLVASDYQKIECLAFMYLVTGEESYGYSAILHSLNYLETACMQNNSEYHKSIFGGTAFYVMSEVYDWCYGLLTPELKEQLAVGSLNKLAAFSEVGCPPYAKYFITTHSTGQPILRNYTAFAIATYDEYPEVYHNVIGQILENFTDGPNWYYQSEYNFQGSDYGMGKTHFSITNDLLIQIATGERIYNVDFSKLVTTFIYRLRPDETPVKVGDCYTKSMYNKGGNADYIWMTFFGGSVYKDPTAKAWFKQSSNDFARLNFSCMDISPAMVMFFNDPDLIPTEKDKYGLAPVRSTRYPSTSVVARSAWNDENAWFTFTNMEEAYGGNHDHRDTGTFQIYYKGILALDAGVYEYGDGQLYGSLYDRTYAKQTISKNGLLIFNPNMKSTDRYEYSGGQSIEWMHDSPDLKTWLNSPASKEARLLGISHAVDEGGKPIYSYIASDITGAYDEESVDSVSRATMTLSTDDPAHPMAYMVYDRITTTDPAYKKTFLLHTMNEPSFRGGKFTAPTAADKFTYVEQASCFTYTNLNGPAGSPEYDNADGRFGGRLTVNTLLPEAPVYRYIGGDGKRLWVNNANAGVERLIQYPRTEIGWGRVELSPSAENMTDSFLNVMYVSDAVNTRHIPARLVRCETHEGALTFGSCVMFSKQTERTNERVSFDTSDMAEGELNYYVTGLCDGTWRLCVGNAEKEVGVTKDGGIAVFTAPVGEVVLTLAK